MAALPIVVLAAASGVCAFGCVMHIWSAWHWLARRFTLADWLALCSTFAFTVVLSLLIRGCFTSDFLYYKGSSNIDYSINNVPGRVLLARVIFESPEAREVRGYIEPGLNLLESSPGMVPTFQWRTAGFGFISGSAPRAVWVMGWQPRLITFTTGQDVLLVPLWPFAFIFAVTPLMWLHRRLQRSYRARNHQCLKCGYDLRTHKPGEKCPECGTSIKKNDKIAG
jgi:hypothetical protein